MREMEIRKIDAEHGKDVCLIHHPFRLWGRPIPALQGGKRAQPFWKNECDGEERFLDETYGVEKDDGIFLDAYLKDVCVGVALLLVE